MESLEQAWERLQNHLTPVLELGVGMKVMPEAQDAARALLIAGYNVALETANLGSGRPWIELRARIEALGKPTTPPLPPPERLKGVEAPWP